MLSSCESRKYVRRSIPAVNEDVVLSALEAIERRFGVTIQERTRSQPEMFGTQSRYPVKELLPVEDLVPVMLFTETDFKSKEGEENADKLLRLAMESFSGFGETRLTFNFNHHESPL